MSRTLPPVYSPLAPQALVGGWWASLRRGAAASAEGRVRAALRARGFDGDLVFTDSGTSALALAIRLVASRGPVAIPAYGCFDLATAVDAAGAEFILYDLDPATLAPAPGALEGALAAGAGGIVVIHLYGVPVDIPAVRALLPAGTLVVDDAAQGVGATVRGVPLGALGTYGVLSFGRGKGLTGGSGGVLLLSRASGAQRPALPPSRDGAARALVTTMAQWLLARPGLYALPRALPFLGLGETHYRPPHTATGISPFALGVLADGVTRVDGELTVRRRTAQRYRDAFADLRNITWPVDTDGSGWLRFPIIVSEAALAAARDPDSARLGIMPGYPTALSDLEGFGARRGNRDAAFPGARLLASRLFTLPTHGALASRDVDAVIARVRSWG